MGIFLGLIILFGIFYILELVCEFIENLFTRKKQNKKEYQIKIDR
jgi:hypothetical protein